MDQLLEAFRTGGVIGVLAVVIGGFYTDRLRTGTMSDKREAALLADRDAWKALYFGEVARANAAEERMDGLAESLKILLGDKIKVG